MATRNALATAVLLVTLGAAFVLGGYAVAGATGAGVGLATGLAGAFCAYWYGDALAIEAAGAVRVTEAEQPVLFRLVRELSQKSPMPKLYVLRGAQPNAFATGRSPARASVVVTTSLLALLDEAELRAVLAHELSHVASRDTLITSVATAIGMALTSIAHVTLWSTALRGRRRSRLVRLSLTPLILVTVPVAAAILRLSLPHSREYLADRSAAALVGDGEPLARALTKLGYASGRVPMRIDAAHATAYTVDPLRRARGHVAMLALLAVHPPIEDRIAQLESYRHDRGHSGP